MKKLLLITAVVAAFAPIGAQAGHNGRTVTGVVALPTASDGTQPVSRQARCMATLGGPNDVVGHVESLDADEGDGTHTFSTSGAADWDIVFYVSMATCDSNAIGAVAFSTAGNESGTIPEGSTAAILVFKSPGANEAFGFTID